uniref:hypothetical protein n=1 Tax=Streptobacillus moniliformis TaxID=34105 RepID=UPI0018C8A8ED
RAIRVDLNEIRAMLQCVPTTVDRGPRNPFGPKATIVDIPAQAEITDARLGGTENGGAGE